MKKLIFAITTVVASELIQNNTLAAQNYSTPMQNNVIYSQPATVNAPQNMETDSRCINSVPQVIPWRTTIDPVIYQQLKDEAEAQRTSGNSKINVDDSTELPDSSAR